MTPRSYEFTCKSCGRTVTESSDSEVCSNCALNPMGPAAVPAPVVPSAPPPPKAPAKADAPKRPGFTVTIKPKCEFCGGKGTVGSQPCPKCGGKK